MNHPVKLFIVFFPFNSTDHGWCQRRHEISVPNNKPCNALCECFGPWWHGGISVQFDWSWRCCFVCRNRTLGQTSRGHCITIRRRCALHRGRQCARRHYHGGSTTGVLWSASAKSAVHHARRFVHRRIATNTKYWRIVSKVINDYDCTLIHSAADQTKFIVSDSIVCWSSIRWLHLAARNFSWTPGMWMSFTRDHRKWSVHHRVWHRFRLAHAHWNVSLTAIRRWPFTIGTLCCWPTIGIALGSQECKSPILAFHFVRNSILLASFPVIITQSRRHCSTVCVKHWLAFRRKDLTKLFAGTKIPPRICKPAWTEWDWRCTFKMPNIVCRP